MYSFIWFLVIVINVNISPFFVAFIRLDFFSHINIRSTEEPFQKRHNAYKYIYIHCTHISRQNGSMRWPIVYFQLALYSHNGFIIGIIRRHIYTVGFEVIRLYDKTYIHYNYYEWAKRQKFPLEVIYDIQTVLKSFRKFGKNWITIL